MAWKIEKPSTLNILNFKKNYKCFNRFFKLIPNLKMRGKYEEKTIEFNGKYITGEPLKIFQDFKYNKYIIKPTGCGGTTAVLNYKGGNCLIISPTVGMIKGKENINKNDNCFFIYGGCTDQWKAVYDYLTSEDKDTQNIIINTTPNQIALIKKSNEKLFNLLIEIPVFIDEYHSYTIDSDYRLEGSYFLDLVDNEWIAKYTLSTATPNYKLLDSLKNVDVVYTLKRIAQPIKHLKISNKAKDVKQFVNDEVGKGRLVVVFSNDITVHKGFSNFRVKNLVGENLGIKLKPFNRGVEVDKELFNDVDVLILSSAYYAGFDVDIDCSICVVSNQGCDAFKIGVNDLVQCYGRARQTVHNALFVNIKKEIDFTTKKPTYYPTSLIEIDKSYKKFELDFNYNRNLIDSGIYDFGVDEEIKGITPQLRVNKYYLLNSVFDSVLNFQLYNDAILLDCLNDYGFEIATYISSDSGVPYFNNSTPFNERLNNLLEYDKDKLCKWFSKAKYNLKSKADGSFSHSLAFELLTTHILKSTDATVIIDKLNNNRVKPNELYKSLNLYLQYNLDTSYYFNPIRPNQINKVKHLYNNKSVAIDGKNGNEWQYLYGCHKVSKNIFPPEVEREISLYTTFYDVKYYTPFLNDKSHRTERVFKAITDVLSTIDINITADEKEWLKEVSKAIYKELDHTGKYVNHNTRKAIKNKMINVLLFLLTDGKFGSVTHTKNREYSPISQTPRALRCILPLMMVAVDLSSANPQIIDYILGSTIGLKVYGNLMKKRGYTRNKAKKVFNSCLNNHYQSVSDAKKVYLDCGYSDSNATILSKMTAGVAKGSFYEIMTLKEKELMQAYQTIIPVKGYRFHDAIIFPLEKIEEMNITLPTSVNGFKYYCEIFNDGSVYTGLTTDEDYKDLGIVSNYQFV